MRFNHTGFKIKVCLVLQLLGTIAIAQNLPETIYVAIAPTHAPYTNQDESGEFSGYEIDVLKEACEIMTVTCKIEAVEWRNIIANVRFSKYHLLAGGMGITNDRKRLLSFSTPTVEGETTSFATVKDSSVDQFLRSIKNDDVDYVKNMLIKMSSAPKVGAISGMNYTHMSHYFGENTVAYDTTDQLIAALTSNEVQAVYSDTDNLKAAAKKNENITIIKNGINPPSSGVGFATVPKNQAVIDALDIALMQMIEAGRLKEIAKNWINPDNVP